MAKVLEPNHKSFQKERDEEIPGSKDTLSFPIISNFKISFQKGDKDKLTP